MNVFYTLPKFTQWIIAVIMMSLLIILMGVWMRLSSIHVLFTLGVFFIVPFFQFLATPIFTLTKVYTYLSPMLLVYAANNKTYDLHNGTGFDYLLVKADTPAGLKWRQKLLAYYLEGLLLIIEKIENNELPDTLEIRGSSYFFSDQTAKRLGFTLKETQSHEKFNIYLNYLDLLWMFSISKGRLSFPNVGDIKTASITGSELVKRKERFKNLLEYLNSKSS